MALILYFLASFYFGRKNPLFYLLLPLALQQGAAAFIDQSFSIAGKKIFSVYDTVFKDVLFFIVISISVFLIKVKFPKIEGVGSKLILFYLVYLLLLFFTDYFAYHQKDEVILTARNFFYIPAAYFLWLSIFQSVNRQQYEGLLRVIFYVTPISALLYVLNSSGKVSIFPKELIYVEVELSSSSVLRDFATMPLFLIPVLVMSIQSLLMPILKLPKYILLLNMGLLPVALVFTFTRSLIVSVVMQLLIMVALNSLRKGAAGIKQAVTFVLLFLVFLVPVYVVAQRVFPSQMDYLISRFTNVSDEGIKEQNVDVRVSYLNEAIRITDYTSSTFGAGMSREYYERMNNLGAWNADSTIPYFLLHTGWLGVAFLYLILIWFSVKCVLYFFKTGDWLIAYLASNFISLTVSSLIMGGLELNGSVWTFMNLALFITIRYNLWKKTIVMVPAEWIAFMKARLRPVQPSV